VILDGRMAAQLSRFFSSTCTIERSTPSQNDYGEKVHSWSALYSDVECVFGFRPRASLAERRLEPVRLSQNEYVLILAGDYSDVTTADRAQVDGSYYNIVDVRTDPTDAMTQLTLEEVKPV